MVLPEGGILNAFLRWRKILDMLRREKGISDASLGGVKTFGSSIFLESLSEIKGQVKKNLFAAWALSLYTAGWEKPIRRRTNAFCI